MMSFIHFQEEKKSVDPLFDKFIRACEFVAPTKGISGARTIQVAEVNGEAVLHRSRQCSIFAAIIIGTPIIRVKALRGARRIDTYAMVQRETGMKMIDTFAFADGFNNYTTSIYHNNLHACHSFYLLGRKVRLYLLNMNLIKRFGQ